MRSWLKLLIFRVFFLPVGVAGNFFSSRCSVVLLCSCKWKHPWRFHAMLKRVHVHVHVRTARALWQSCGPFWYMCTTQTMILCVSLVNVLFMSYTHHPCHAHTIFGAENVQCRWNDSALLFSNFSVRSLGAQQTARRTIEIGAKLMHFAFFVAILSFHKHQHIHMIYLSVCVHFENRVILSPTTLTINKFRGEFSDLFISLTCYLHWCHKHTHQNILSGLQKGNVGEHEKTCRSCRKKAFYECNTI